MGLNIPGWQPVPDHKPVCQRPAWLKCSPQAHGVVRTLYHRLKMEGGSIEWLADKSGVDRQALAAWKRGTPPRLHNLSACLAVLEVEVVAQPDPQREPVAVVPDSVPAPIHQTLRRCHPLVRQLFDVMYGQRWTIEMLSSASGVGYETVLAQRQNAAAASRRSVLSRAWVQADREEPCR